MVDDEAPLERTSPELVRSEERAQVSFPLRVRGRVRLTKRVVTEEVTYTFTLRREVLEVEELPGDEPVVPLSWTDVLPDEPREPFEILLHTEQIVPTTVVVPVERVRVGTQIVSTDVLVAADLQSERVAVEQDDASDNYTRGSAAGGGTPATKEEFA